MLFLYGLITGMLLFLVIEFLLSKPLAIIIIEFKERIVFEWQWRTYMEVNPLWWIGGTVFAMLIVYYLLGA